MKKAIFTSNAPSPIGPYVQAVAKGDFLFISGQLGIDMSTGKLAEDVVSQAKCSVSNLAAILKENNMTFEHVLKSTIFLTDLNDFTKVNEVYGGCFGDTPPARSCIQVAGLPLGALVEIEVIASK